MMLNVYVYRNWRSRGSIRPLPPRWDDNGERLGEPAEKRDLVPGDLVTSSKTWPGVGIVLWVNAVVPVVPFPSDLEPSPSIGVLW